MLCVISIYFLFLIIFTIYSIKSNVKNPKPITKEYLNKLAFEYPPTYITYKKIKNKPIHENPLCNFINIKNPPLVNISYFYNNLYFFWNYIATIILVWKKKEKELESMKKLLFIFSVFSFILFSDSKEASASTSEIDQYVQFNSVTKGSNNTITVKYTVKKNIPASHTLTVRSYWTVHQSTNTTKTITLNKKAGAYTTSFKASGELIGPQYIEAKAVIASRLTQTKKIQTFGKYPTTTVTSHTVSASEAVASHIAITAGIASFKLAAKKNPYGLLFNLAAFGAAATYTGKSLNVVGGYPSPAKGQYIRTSVGYNQSGQQISVKMWANQESYKKGVTPLYTYNQTHPW